MKCLTVRFQRPKRGESRRRLLCATYPRMIRGYLKVHGVEAKRPNLKIRRPLSTKPRPYIP